MITQTCSLVTSKNSEARKISQLYPHLVEKQEPRPPDCPVFILPGIRSPNGYISVKATLESLLMKLLNFPLQVSDSILH